MGIEQFDHFIVENGLKRIAGDIHPLWRESIRLDADPGSSTVVAAGTSHLGGVPDLPAGAAWPVGKGKPLSFVGQIRLVDLSSFAGAGGLPSAGLLSFFYDSAQETYGAAPGDDEGWQVLYLGAGAPLQTIAFPDGLAKEARFQSAVIRFHSEWTLPSSPQQVAPGLRWSDQEQQGYEALLQQLKEANAPGFRHRMFGWPDQIQDDMQLQSAMFSAGVVDMADSRMEVVNQQKSNWQLLLQIDSDERIGMRWASYGMLYYWIEAQAIKAAQFEKTWLVLQSD